MDQIAGNSSSLGGESSRGAGFGCCRVLEFYSLTEKVLVRIAREPPSTKTKKVFVIGLHELDLIRSPSGVLVRTKIEKARC